MNKASAKLLAAVALLAVAAGIYFYNTRAEPIPDTDDTRTQWFCTQAGKGFELSGPESQDKVKMRRKQAADESNPGAFRGRDVMEQVALSPFSGEYTGVEAFKCPRCGEIFAARNGRGENNICLKCKWDPLAIEGTAVDNSQAPSP